MERRPARDYPRGRCLHELIEAQVGAHARTRWRWSSSEERSTYRELNRARQRAGRTSCASWASGPDVLVGIYMERSLEMLVGAAGRA